MKILVRDLLSRSPQGRSLLELYWGRWAADGAAATTSADAGDAVNRLASTRPGTLGSKWHLASAAGKRTRNDVRVTISAVMHDSAKWIDGFMTALLASSYDLHRVTLVLVDNGSTDDSLELARDWADKHRSRFEHATVVSRPNLGYGAGNDFVIRNTGNELVLVTNLDVEFHRDMLATLVNCARSDDADVASWEARQYPFEHPKYYDPVTLEVNWQSHCCVLLRRSAYLAVGGYDEALFMYGEDVELSYRIRSSGFRLRYVPAAVVTHHIDPHTPRPLQISGSTAANLLIRYRYGTIRDRLVGEGMLVGAGATVADDSTRRELSRARDLVRQNRGRFRKSKRPPANAASFPFRGFDYEMIRPGARYRSDQPFLDGPKVSVVTRTTPGREWLLREAIASVLNQTYRNIEHVVVEQGPGDLREEVERLAQAYGRDIRHVKGDRVGRSSTGNLGLSVTTGEYVMLLDDDDLLFSDHVEVLAEALFDDPGAVAAHAPSWDVRTEFDPERKTHAERLHLLPQGLAAPFTADDVRHHNIAPIQAVMFRRSLYARLGGFHEDMHALEDWNLWARYSHAGRFVFVPKLTSLFRTPFSHGERLRRESELHAAYPAAQARNASDIARMARDSRAPCPCCGRFDCRSSRRHEAIARDAERGGPHADPSKPTVALQAADIAQASADWSLRRRQRYEPGKTYLCRATDVLRIGSAGRSRSGFAEQAPGRRDQAVGEAPPESGGTNRNPALIGIGTNGSVLLLDGHHRMASAHSCELDRIVAVPIQFHYFDVGDVIDPKAPDVRWDGRNLDFVCFPVGSCGRCRSCLRQFRAPEI